MSTAPAKLLLLLLLPAACGSLPRPFEGRPGPLAARLLQPPPPRLAVPSPTGALLSDSAGDTLAGAVADALVGIEVPAVAHAIRPGDWQLMVTAEMQGMTVVPTFTVRDPRGKPQGSLKGVGMPAKAWSDGDPLVMKLEAVATAPKIASLLTSIDAARKRSDPHSLYNRPAQVAVPDVTGAPGDGNQALAQQMRIQLPRMGDVVQDTAASADFTVAGQVRTAPESNGNMRIEIQWLITDAAGHDLGRVVQINEVPPGSLDHYWGDVAMVVAQEAAGAAQQVILKQSGHTPADQAAAAASPASAAAPSSPLTAPPPLATPSSLPP